MFGKQRAIQNDFPGMSEFCLLWVHIVQTVAAIKYLI